MSDGDFIDLCKYGRDERAVVEAIMNGANVNAKDKDWSITALMLVAEKGYTEAVELLLKYGADVNAKTDYGQTALMLVAKNGKTDTAELLLKHGADVNSKNFFQETALMKAESQDHTDTANLLRKYGAK